MGDRTDTEDFRKKEFQFLLKCHELTAGKESAVTHMDKVGRELGLQPAVNIAVHDRLVAEGLIRPAGLGGEISITPEGIARLQASRS
jgi:hypothetical protein